MSSIINEEIQRYVDDICGLIKNKKVHSTIKEEITNHIEELTQDYIDVGLSEKEAVEKAIKQMGSAEVVGMDLNKIHKAAPDWITIGLTSVFVLVGIFVLWFIQENNILSDKLYYINYFKNTVIYVLLALLIGIAILKVDYKYFKKYSWYIYGCGVVLLIAPFFFGSYIGGSFRWIRIGNLALNTLVISPYIILLGLSGIFEKWNWNSKKQLLIGMALAIIPSVLILLTPSIPDFLIYIVGAMIVLIISGIGIKYITYTNGVIAVIGFLCIVISPYRIERIMALFNPEKYADGVGWMSMKIAELSKDAGFFGKGAELSKNILPEVHTDYIFTFIIYCFGWIAGIVLILLICTFIVRIGLIGSKIKDRYGKLIVCGFCGLISTQFILAMLANINVLPIFSVSMPFISYGGSSLVINVLSVSIISNVFKWRNSPCKA